LKLAKGVSLWVATLILIVLFISAAKWQFNKGLNLNHKNQKITRSQLAPILLNPRSIDPISDQWRRVTLDGHFLTRYELMKNQYQNGIYGFHVLQDFQSNSLGRILIDRGWIKAGVDAKSEPKIPMTSSAEEEVVVRIRSEFLSPQLAGTFFAYPTKGEPQRRIYFDLLASKVNPPLSQIELPDLSTGPHFAYALQWTLFAVVILYLRILFSKRSKL
jgi:surfeit locus 1 family protein